MLNATGVWLQEFDVTDDPMDGVLAPPKEPDDAEIRQRLPTVLLDSSVVEAAGVLKDQGVATAPVLDREGRLLGVLSVLPQAAVATTVHVAFGTPFSEVARVMAMDRVHRVAIVTDQGRTTVGVFSALALREWAGRKH